MMSKAFFVLDDGRIFEGKSGLQREKLSVKQSSKQE